jgi:hypothetical protein
MPHNDDRSNLKVQVSHIETQKHVTSGQRSKSGKMVSTKSHQSYVVYTQKQVVTDIMVPTPNALSLVNGAQIKYFLEANNARNIQKLDIRFQVTVSGGPLKLPPVSKWFDRLEFYVRNTGKEICRLYSDVLHTMVNSEDTDKLRQYQETYNQSLVYDRNQENNKIAINGQQYFYLPLPYSFFRDFGLDLNTIQSDIELRFHPNAAVMGQFNGSLTLDELAAIIEESHPDDASDRAHRDFLSKHVLQHTFVDSQQYVDAAQVINASTQYEYDLDQFDKPSSALLMCIRSANSFDFQSMSLGEGSFDLIGVSGESLYGAGRNVIFNYFNKHIVCEQFGNDFFEKTNFVLVPFCHVKDAFRGITHGLHVFDSSKKRLRIVTPPAGTLEVWTAVFSASAATYIIRVHYENSYVDLAANATPAVMTTNVSNMLSSYGLRAVVTQVAGPPYQVIFTLSTLAGQPIKPSSELRVEIAANTGATTFNSFTKTTQGLDGWLNGTYDVTIYSLYHRNIFQDGQHLKVLDM